MSQGMCTATGSWDGLGPEALLEPPEGTSPTDTPIRLILHSDLQRRDRVNVCCFSCCVVISTAAIGDLVNVCLNIVPFPLSSASK